MKKYEINQQQYKMAVNIAITAVSNLIAIESSFARRAILNQTEVKVPFDWAEVAIVGATIRVLAFATSVANSASIARHKFDDSSVSISASALDAADVAEAADADRCGCEFESG